MPDEFDGAPFGVATTMDSLTLPGEVHAVVLDALGHHGTESIAWGVHTKLVSRFFLKWLNTRRFGDPRRHRLP